MKKVIAIALVILTLAALLCACGGNKTGQVKTTVESKYDDGYAQSYASGTSTDENGNKVYEFTEEKYEEYVDAHKNTIAKDIVNMHGGTITAASDLVNGTVFTVRLWIHFDKNRENLRRA